MTSPHFVVIGLTEWFVSESALLSDEAVEAAARNPFDRGGSDTYWDELEADTKEKIAEDFRESLRAALSAISKEEE